MGDPHQSIYGFRGADVRGILDFPGQFPTSSGERAPVLVLRRTRRFGARLLLAAGRISARLPLTGSIGTDAREAFLSPEAVPGPHGEGRVEIHTFDTDRAESEHLADLLRRAHPEDGIDWSQMAVLVRSGRASIPPLRRALAAAGVPVEVASDDVPLVRDPAVLPLLDGLRAVVNLDNTDPDSPDFLDPGRIESLLLSPLGGLDAGDLRSLTRRLRARQGRRCAPHEPRAVAARRGGRRIPRRPRRARGRALPGPRVPAARGGSPAGAACERRGRAVAPVVRHHVARAVATPGRPGAGRARRAHKDLDSICALFEVTARCRAPRPRRRRRVLLQPRRPADSRRHPRRARRARVVRPPAHRPPVQGARVGAGRGRARAAGGLARPATSLQPARCRPDRAGRSGHS
ncbi:hypothetical protein [Nocardioides sp. B-3]|uniref:hypothetical protein n=1 Tax=Nocardioides sp. B-3 TaxID=2895565 RepID=UPI00300DC607